MLAAVLTKEPEWAKTPARVHPLLHRWLERDPKKRLRDIGDANPGNQTESETAGNSASVSGLSPG
jgi:hypothetical protein